MDEKLVEAVARHERKKDNAERSKKALLDWHSRLLIEAYKPQSFLMLSSLDVQRLVDNLLDAALALEEQSQLAATLLEAAIIALILSPQTQEGG